MNPIDREHKNSVHRLCETVAEQYTPVFKTASARRLIRRIRTAHTNTEKVFMRAAVRNGKEQQLTDAFLWLTDNYTFIDEFFLVNISALKKVHGTTDKDCSMFCFDAAYELCRLCEGNLSHSHIDALAEECDKACPDGLQYDDFASFPVLVNCAVLCFIGSICKRFSDTNGIFESETAGRSLISAIKTLKTLSVHNYSECFCKCGAEKILVQDPLGIYPVMTEESKASLREKIRRLSKKHCVTDTEYARRMLDNALKKQGDERYIGYFVKEETIWKKVYYPLLLLVAGVLSAAMAYIFGIWMFFVAFFPLYEGASLVLNVLVSRTCKKDSTLPEINLHEIPDEARTLCVITTLLQGEKRDAELFSRLEHIYNANSGKNIRFGVLCDLCDAETATKSSDEATVKYASGRINSLNTKYGDNFMFFIRPRSYSKSEKCFMAYERKRGAVIELVKLICGKECSFDMNENSVLRNLDYLHSVKYVITLDADTNLGLDTAKQLVGKMLHPQNRPVTDKKLHKVIKGYGIMQPKMSTELKSSGATPFTRLMCGGGGTDLYSGASFDLYQTLFDEGSFCGKGIFDAQAFYETIVSSQFFPEDAVLSHDIPEGERLKTALLCDVELTDGFPKNELSYLKRKHRWVRGDIQNTIFLKNSIKVSGKKTKNDLSFFSRFKLADNIRRALTPAFSLLLMVLTLFYDKPTAHILFAVAFLPYAVPFVADTVTLVFTLTFRCAARKFFSKGVTAGIWQSFLRMLCSGAMLAKDAMLSTGAALTSVYRMTFSKRKLLEWVTAAQSDSGKNTLMLYISRHIFSSLLGAFLFAFSHSGLVKLWGLAVFVMPIVGYYTGKEHEAPGKKVQSKKIQAYASDIWRFFKDNVTAADNYLPPDNISIAPYKKTAHRTSPTNIGLYIACLVAARDFGFIDSAELYEKLKCTLDTVEKLPKWKGHLYNWYDTEKLTLLNPTYVSSVDSGNFTACVIAAKNGLYDYTGEQPSLVELINRMTRIIEGADYSYLYNETRGLFYVGATVNGGKADYDTGCYDFLMSEARILSYVAVASRTVPKAHWKKLGRPLVTSGGYIGISSWSGTAFEYFMPELFMPAQKGSFLYEAMVFAFRAQTLRCADKVWGISESGFFSFDCDLNYRYKAFGVPMLGQKSGLDKELVISPYSSFLAMCVSHRRVFENLDNLKKLGIYGKYGFYEAVDFTPYRVKEGFACVKSYMSHHLGMSLLALSNAQNGGVSRRFMNDCTMACGCELLEERIPVNAVIKKLKRGYGKRIHFEKSKPDETVYIGYPSYANPAAACVSDGKTSCIVSDCGHVRISKGNILFNTNDCAKYPAEHPHTLSCYLYLDGKAYGLTPLSAKPSADSRFSFSYTECSATHKLVCDKGEFSLSYTVSGESGSPVRIKLSGKARSAKNRFAFVFTPCLATPAAYNSHPAFSELFIEAEYDSEKNILYFKRRRRSPAEEQYILAVAPAKNTAEISFATRKSAMCGKDIYSDPFAAFDYEEKGKVGACVNPLCIVSGNYDGEAEIVTALCHSIAEAENVIASARKKTFEETQKSLTEISEQFRVASGISSVGSDASVRDVLSGIMFGGTDRRRKRNMCEYVFGGTASAMSMDMLWKHGISGDHAIVLADAGGMYFPSPLERIIRAFKLLTMKNVRFDLVIAYREQDKYFGKNHRRIMDIISSCACDGYTGRNCGIYLVEKSDMSDMRALRCYASAIIDIYSDNPHAESVTPAFVPFYPILNGKALPTVSDGFCVKGGCFTDNGFCTDKKRKPHAPWAHVLSGENISCIVTENSLGTTFYKNASEMKITPGPAAGLEECHGERLYLSENGVVFDLAACAEKVMLRCGSAVYVGKISDVDYKITVFCDAKLPVKVIKLELEGALSDNQNVFMYTEPVMGTSRKGIVVNCETDNTVVFKNPMSHSFGNYTGLVTVKYAGETFCISDKADLYSLGRADSGNEDIACVGAKLCKCVKTEMCFLLGACRDGSGVRRLINTSFDDLGKEAQIGSEMFCSSMLPDISFSTAKQGCDVQSIRHMFNTFLPYSAVFSRMLARSGFYQTGGAYGYRDQLQDCLALIYSAPKRAYAHICRAAAHQFEQGDVLHWWHGCTAKGVRTLCSDDYLWLPYVCCEYAAVTGNYGIFDVEVPYICGDALKTGEGEKYIPYSKSELSESIYMHCVRALDLACSRLGVHGLSLMGTCDWCDGYSFVGKDGKGESVWCSMFLAMILDKFRNICKNHGNAQRNKRYEDMAQQLRLAITTYGFDKEGGYFIRGYYDDGDVLGGTSSDEASIDVLPQAFSFLCGLPTEYCVSALKAAQQLLYDEKLHIMKLVYPPFDKTQKEPGYIKGYIPGVRENGGQYTHGALFAAMGYFECAKALATSDPDTAKSFADTAGKILLYSNPAYRSCDDAGENTVLAYLTEPYAVAADIYSNPQHAGRGGWTHYTGAAAWMYRLLLRYAFGLNVTEAFNENGCIKADLLCISSFGGILDGSCIVFKEFGFDVTIKYVNDKKTAFFADGRQTEPIITKQIRTVEIHF